MLSIGDKVKVSRVVNKSEPTGAIVGTCAYTSFTTYIILLDEPLEIGGEQHLAVAVPAYELRKL